MNKEEATFLNKAMGQRVKALRTEKGWEVETVAKRAGVGPFTWTKIEAGVVHVTYDTFISMCVALEIHPKEFMDFDYLGVGYGILDKAIGRPSPVGFFRFFGALEMRGKVSKALREELGNSLKIVQLSKESQEQTGEWFYFALDGSMLIVQAMDRAPYGFLTTGNFFFDMGRFSGAGKNRFFLRSLKDTVLYAVPIEAMLRMIELHRTMRVLLRNIWEETVDMADARRNFLQLTGMGRVSAMYKRYPEWIDLVPVDGLQRYLGMGKSFQQLNRQYKEYKKRLSEGGK